MTFIHRRRNASLAVALLVLFLLSLAPLSAQSKATTSATWLYDLVPFDLPGEESTRLGGINNQNDVVGSSFDGVRIRPFLVSGGVLSFPALPDGAYPEDINDIGQIVGEFYGSFPHPYYGPYGFVYSSETWQFAAPLPPLLATSSALGINNYGNIVGSYVSTCAFCGERGAYFDDITVSGLFSYGGINDAGDIVGNAPNGAFWRSAGGETPISVPAAVGTTPHDISNVNTIVGEYYVWGSNGNAERHGFVSSKGRYVSIDVPGAWETRVEGVNDAGVIVGTYDGAHGFVGIPRSPVDVTINGADGPVTIDPGQPLQVQIQFTAPPDGPLNPAEVYIGVVSPIGLLWLDPATGTFVPTPTLTFAGALPAFGPTSLVNLPDATALPSGTWWWFMIVDDDSNGTIEGAFFDVAQMIVP